MDDSPVQLRLAVRSGNHSKYRMKVFWVLFILPGVIPSVVSYRTACRVRGKQPGPKSMWTVSPTLLASKALQRLLGGGCSVKHAVHRDQAPISRDEQTQYSAGRGECCSAGRRRPAVVLRGGRSGGMSATAVGSQKDIGRGSVHFKGKGSYGGFIGPGNCEGIRRTGSIFPLVFSIPQVLDVAPGFWLSGGVRGQ